MKIPSSNGIDIDFQPWFSKGYGLSMIHITEQLGGRLAEGEIALIHNGSKDAMEAYNELNDGVLTIIRENSANYTIPVIVRTKTMNWSENYVTLSVFCGITNKSFAADNMTSDWPDIKSAITNIFPGKTNIKCESDVKLDPGDRLFQCNEPGASFLKRLCFAYKRNSVFGFGWEGLILKETYDVDDQTRKESLVADTSVVQLDAANKSYSPKLYNLPMCPWTDKDKKDKGAKDYTKFESNNLKVLKTYSDFNFVKKGYDIMQINASYNKLYSESSLFQSFRIIDSEIPKYKLGWVIKYQRANSMTPDAITDSSNLFLVKSNELFYAAPGSNYTDEDGRDFSWTTKLLGIETTKDGKTKIGLGTEDDPLDNNQ
jgi:hypothetical protein